MVLGLAVQVPDCGFKTTHSEREREEAGGEAGLPQMNERLEN